MYSTLAKFVRYKYTQLLKSKRATLTTYPEPKYLDLKKLKCGDVFHRDTSDNGINTR